MAQPDFREGVYDDGDNNITGILDVIVGKAPGVVAGYAHDLLKQTIREFYKKTLAWREFVEIGALTEADMPYDVNPLRDEAIRAHTVTALSLDGNKLGRLSVGERTMANKYGFNSGATLPVVFYCHPPSVINFLHPLPESTLEYTATVAVVPLMKTDELPQWCVDNHEEAFIAGTMHKLYYETKKPYSDPYKAMYHGKEWRYYINLHKAEAQKNYGDAEHEWTFPRGTR